MKTECDYPYGLSKKTATNANFSKIVKPRDRDGNTEEVQEEEEARLLWKIMPWPKTVIL